MKQIAVDIIDALQPPSLGRKIANLLGGDRSIPSCGCRIGESEQHAERSRSLGKRQGREGKQRQKRKKAELSFHKKLLRVSKIDGKATAESGGAGRNRTAAGSFAGSCLSTWRPRLDDHP